MYPVSMRSSLVASRLGFGIVALIPPQWPVAVQLGRRELRVAE
jgi:hypothetical protein